LSVLRFGPIDEEIARYRDAASLCQKVAGHTLAQHMKLKLLHIAGKFEHCASGLEEARPRWAASANQ
jgi:hypothetical protein